MAWGKIDDGFYDHPKTVSLWRRNPGAVGLHIRGISYCAKHLTDGYIQHEIVNAMAPVQRDRDEMIQALIEEKTWYENGEEGFAIHDYLDWNPSKEEVLEKRRKDRERKQAKNG